MPHRGGDERTAAAEPGEPTPQQHVTDPGPAQREGAVTGEDQGVRTPATCQDTLKEHQSLTMSNILQKQRRIVCYEMAT